MSGISGSGRHVASHAKPSAVSNAKGKVKTAAAVTSVLAVSGGVATAFHLHQDGLRNSAEAASQDSNTAAAAAAANALLAQRDGTNAANRDTQRPTLGQTTPGTPAPSSSSSAAPTSAGSSTPPVPSSTSTSTPTATRSETPLPSQTPTTSKTTTTPKPSSSSSGSSSTNMGYNATPAQAKAIAESVVPSSQFLCFSNIIERESSWNIHATNPSSGAYGLPQALPGYKMASMGADWQNSALVQIKWALSYMTGRYGSPCAAWAFWQAHNWY